MVYLYMEPYFWGNMVYLYMEPYLISVMEMILYFFFHGFQQVSKDLQVTGNHNSMKSCLTV